MVLLSGMSSCNLWLIYTCVIGGFFYYRDFVNGEKQDVWLRCQLQSLFSLTNTLYRIHGS